MWRLPDPIGTVRDLLDLGGTVLLPIMIVAFVMWALIVERHWYFYVVHPTVGRELLRQWQRRADRTSWYAHQVRSLLIAALTEKLNRSVATIKALVALCPLLGLLGTITGMIEVFDILAIAGSGNARAMASGVYKAIIPTMAGLVVALSGFYFAVRLERFVNEEAERFSDHLTHA